MKLIRCHIENFGVLSDFDFAFDDGLTIICQGNGFGKSTFAAFIKSNKEKVSFAAVLPK